LRIPEGVAMYWMSGCKVIHAVALAL